MGLWLVLLWLALPKPVAAYLDPGAGSMLLQGVIAGLAATIAAVSVYWRAVRDLFRRLVRRASSSNDGRSGQS